MKRYSTMQSVASFNQFKTDFKQYIEDNGIVVVKYDGSIVDVLIVTPSILRTRVNSYLNKCVFPHLK